MAQTPFIVCDNLVKIYKIAELELVALQGLDLVINTGELVGVVGASGSGKSTLMNVLGGLDRPSAGKVWVGGVDLLKLTDMGLDRYRRSQVGFVWQQGSRNLIPYLTAQENIEMPMTLVGSTGKDRTNRSMTLLEMVGLKDRRSHRLSELSGGEQQRVAIAVALANSPRLLLADEPTGEVDSTTAGIIYKIFQTLNQELGLTTLIVSHDPTIARHVQRVVAIRDGKLASETIRKPSQVLEKKVDEKVPGEVKETHEEIVFEELTVLDSAGRLQVPKPYLEKHQIKGRVRLELTKEGILILPVTTVSNTLSVEDATTEIVQSRQAGTFRRILNRLSGHAPKSGRES
jgi:putative ABC transport system ATP-binding protein